MTPPLRLGAATRALFVFEAAARTGSFSVKKVRRMCLSAPNAAAEPTSVMITISATEYSSVKAIETLVK